MKAFKILLVFILLVSCNTPRAVYDYDQQTNFSQYNSYAIYQDLRTGLNELDDRRLLNSLENQLQQKNLSPSENPDLFVNVYSEEYREPNRSSVGIGVGGTGRNVGVGVSGGIPLGGPETFLRLTFDLIDAKRDELVWQAVVDSKFDWDASPERRQATFDAIVAQALKGYPPKK
ncbi:DUF4136 domain-containing protein [Salinimicrobium soli]|uniref:DUF4136 domain-containing protein n=1 Tax=Salinimicrobium soli TaxID=1254399 RepID=UPI003AACCDFE